MHDKDEIVFEDCAHGYQILIVEDNEADQVLLKKQLQKLWPNSKTMVVKSVQDAYVTYMQNNVDLVLLDLNLPDGYGPATVREVRRFNKSIPIIVITGLGNRLTVDEALRLGASNVVMKSQIMDTYFTDILEEHVA